MASKSALLLRASISMLVALALVGCGGGAAPPTAGTPTSNAPTVAPGTATAHASASPRLSAAAKTPAGSGSEGNLGVYATELGSTIELLEDGTCNFQTTKGTLDGCLYLIRGSNIQFSAGDGSQFAYIFANGCIYAGKIGTEDHATFCKN